MTQQRSLSSYLKATLLPIGVSRNSPRFATPGGSSCPFSTGSTRVMSATKRVPSKRVLLSMNEGLVKMRFPCGGKHSINLVEFQVGLLMTGILECFIDKVNL